ncbi:hypothetical protein Q3G72_020611 [Acer saccharum]|nr:hypothetical protein Q3G72_020611 [Acer saccharum]
MVAGVAPWWSCGVWTVAVPRRCGGAVGGPRGGQGRGGSRRQSDDCYSQLKPKNKATYRSWSEKTLMTKKAFLKQSINLGMLICEAFAQIEWA